MRGIEREIRQMRIFATISAMGWAVLILTAATKGKQKFHEIDVERINIVEPGGQVKLVLSNQERLPGPGNIVTGKFYKRVGLKSPGVLFYNDKGDESGGLLFTSSSAAPGKYVAGNLLTFDKYGGDQVLGLRYEEADGRRVAGFNVWDQPDVSPAEQRKNFEAARNLPQGMERDELRQQAVANQRVFIGRSADKTANLTLADANGRTRIRISVAASGEAKIEFLDRDGKVARTLSESEIPKP